MRFQSLQDLENIPVTGAAAATRARPGSSLRIWEPFPAAMGMATVSHYDAQTMIDIFGATQGRDLGGVAKRNRSHR